MVILFNRLTEISREVRVLIADDDPINTAILSELLQNKGYEVSHVPDGLQALSELHRTSFDVLITDWMMPYMDGIALIRTVRREIPFSPAIILITSVTIPSAKELAMDSGADDFINKPFEPKEVLASVQNCIARRQQPFQFSQSPVIKQQLPTQISNQVKAALAEPVQQVVTHPAIQKGIPQAKKKPPFVAVGISTNTGGTAALNRLFQDMPNTDNAVFLVVLQAPVWALDMFTMRLQKMTLLKVVLADDGMPLEGGTVYIARKGRHITVDANTLQIRLVDGAEENFVRPSADILFKSLGSAFAESAVAVILTGIGQDGVQGAAFIVSTGGKIVVQEPSTAEAPFLPKTLVDMDVEKNIVPLATLSKAVAEQINHLAK